MNQHPMFLGIIWQPNHKAEEPEPQAASVTGNNNIVKLSRRTKPTPSVAKEDKVPDISEPVKESKTSLLNSASDFSSAKIKHSRDLQDGKSSKPRQSYSLVQEPSLQHSQTGQSVVRDRFKMSRGSLPLKKMRNLLRQVQL